MLLPAHLGDMSANSNNLFLLLLLTLIACSEPTATVPGMHEAVPATAQMQQQPASDSSKTVYVIVALCDNKYQGIVKVPAGIGNGQDPDGNLYWGAGYGIRSFFKNKNSNWQLIRSEKNVSDTILERLLFKHKQQNIYLLADAYNGKNIKEATTDLLSAAAGNNPIVIENKGQTLGFGGSSSLIAYIGHDGLMDFSIPELNIDHEKNNKEVIILACYSKRFFSAHLKKSGASPLLWTTGLMAPEAYTLHDALQAWVQGKPTAAIRESAAAAYHTYQRCGIKAARNLLVTGW